MQREIIQDLLKEKVIRDQYVQSLREEVGVKVVGDRPSIDLMMQLETNLTSVKQSLNQDGEQIESSMNDLLSKINSAIELV